MSFMVKRLNMSNIFLLCLLSTVLLPDRKGALLHPHHRERVGLTKSAWCALMKLQDAIMAYSPAAVARSSLREQWKVQKPCDDHSHL